MQGCLKRVLNDCATRAGRLKSQDHGFSLIEVSIAVSLFAVLMAAAAQSLLGYSFAMNAQEQKTEAMAHCRAVYAQIRFDRDASAFPFPQQILQTWPHETLVQDPAVVNLNNEVITVTYDDIAANPLNITVTSTWNDMRGRAMSVSLSSLLTGTNR